MINPDLSFHSSRCFKLCQRTRTLFSGFGVKESKTKKHVNRCGGREDTSTKVFHWWRVREVRSRIPMTLKFSLFFRKLIAFWKLFWKLFKTVVQRIFVIFFLVIRFSFYYFLRISSHPKLLKVTDKQCLKKHYCIFSEKNCSCGRLSHFIDITVRVCFSPGALSPQEAPF